MSIRPFRFPEDAQIVVDLIPRVFGDAMGDDQRTSLVNTMKAVRTLRPVILLLKLVMPRLSDYFTGFIYEEAGQPVGMINIIRQGSSDTWRIGNLAILPEYRGSGQALDMIYECLDLFKVRGGKHLFSEILFDNRQMFIVVKHFGGKQFSGSVELTYQPEKSLPIPNLPAEYTFESTSPFDLDPKYQLLKRATPPEVQEFIPIDPSQYHYPVIFRPLMGIYMSISRTTERTFAIRHDGEVVAVGYCSISADGASSLDATLAPDHAALADFVIAKLVNWVMENRAKTQGKIYVTLPTWQPSLIDAACRAGFEKLREYRIVGAQREYIKDRRGRPATE